jgi:hypothetical protein
MQDAMEGKIMPDDSPIALRSLTAVTQAFTAAAEPTLDDLVGEHDGSFTGPGWLRSAAPLAVRAAGMGGWCGKSFAAARNGESVIYGTNLVRHRRGITSSIPVTAEISRSRIDTRPALIVRYPHDARWPWPRVIDELRPLHPGLLLGLTFGLPGGPSSGGPFLLRRR